MSGFVEVSGKRCTDTRARAGQDDGGRFGEQPGHDVAIPFAARLPQLRSAVVNRSLDEQEPALLIGQLRRLAEPARLWRVRKFKRARFDPSENGGQVALLLSGLVKLTYVTRDGEEWIKSFVADPGVFGSLGDDERDAFAAVCIEPSAIVTLSTAWVRGTLATDRDLREAAGAFYAWLSTEKRQREIALLCLNATDRYQSWRRTAPELAARLPQNDIARYLGVTPVAFSRIKRRVRERSDQHM